MTATSRVFLVAGQEIIRLGLRAVLTGTGIKVVGESGSADDALLGIAGLRPDVAIVERGLLDGSGLDVCRRLCTGVVCARCLILNALDDPDARTAASAAGAFGLVGKDVDGAALIGAVRAVAVGTRPADRGGVPGLGGRPPTALRVARERLRSPSARTDRTGAPARRASAGGSD